MQEALGPFLTDEAPLMVFNDSASYLYSYLWRVLYRLATESQRTYKTLMDCVDRKMQNTYFIRIIMEANLV